jgi:hypothetical protein
MILNEPVVDWIPVWFTNEYWLAIALASTLAMGLLLFAIAIKAEDIEWPWEHVIDSYRWIRNRLRR